MAGNTELIDELVAPEAEEQVKGLSDLLSVLDTQFISIAKNAIAFNNAVGNSKGVSDYTKKAQDAVIATEKLKQEQNKTLQTVADLEKKESQAAATKARLGDATERAAAKAEKARSPYQQLSKQLDDLRAKAKDVGAQFGIESEQFKKAAGPVQELDTKLKAIDHTLGQSQRNVGNYGSAFSEVVRAYIPFGEATIKVSENLGKIGGEASDAITEISGLGKGFGEFTIGQFAFYIASATYYLSQFKSTGNEVKQFVGGLKQQFGGIGEALISTLKDFPKKNLFKEIGKNFKGNFQTGVDIAKEEIALENYEQLIEEENRLLRVQSTNLRTQAQDRTLDIKTRSEALGKAQELNSEALKNEKDFADSMINAGIRLGDKFGKLTSAQVDQLTKGDIDLAQRLSQNGQVFTAEGFDLYKKGLDKRLAYQEAYASNVLSIQTDRDNMELRADRSLAQAQERLDKARVEKERDAAKLVLEDINSTYDQKIKANEKYIQSSIKLIQIEKKNQLESAGLGGRGGADSRTAAVNRAAIEQEAQNKINAVKVTGLQQGNAIVKKAQEELKKLFKDGLKGQEETESKEITDFEDTQNNKLLSIEKFKSDAKKALADQYSQGKISASDYNNQVAQIEYDSGRQRIDAQIDAQKKIIALQEDYLKYGIGTNKELQKSKDQLTKFQIAASDLAAQHEIENIRKLEEARSKLHSLEVELVSTSIELVRTLIDAGYSRQLDALKKQSDQVTANADQEKQAVEDSILSTGSKARREKVIEAQAAADRLAITNKENDIKKRQAVFDKAISIAKAAESIATAEIQALTYLSNPYTAYLYPYIAGLIAAVGAAEIATIAAQPIPQYKYGTKSAKAGLGVWGEAGIELAKEPGGKAYFSPDGATLANFPAGTEIMSHTELSRFVSPNKLKAYAGGEAVPWDRLIDVMKKNKPEKQRRPMVILKGEDRNYYRKFYR